MKAHEQTLELEEMISYRVSRLQALLNRQTIAILKENGGLAPTQWRILVVLKTLGICTIAEISRKTKLDKALLSRAVKGLTKRSLIKAKPSPQNRSHLILSLTEAGQEAYERARPFMRKRHDLLVDSLTPDEKNALFLAIRKLEDVLTEEK